MTEIPQSLRELFSAVPQPVPSRFDQPVAGGLLELALPVAIARLLPTGQLDTIALAACGLLAVYALNAGLQIIATCSGHMLGIKTETEMRRRDIDHLQKLSFGFLTAARPDNWWPV